MAEMQRGVVKWFNDAKGFGFIEHESGRDVFVHYSVIESEGFKTLKDGEEVDYELHEGDKGLHANKVLRINQPVKAKPAAEELSAPNLQSGTVNTVNKTSESMIEVDREPESDSLLSTTTAVDADSEAAEKLGQ